MATIARRGVAPAHGVRGERDTLGRRRRTRPISTGKRVTAQERDLLWFRKLREHGPLPTSYLLAFAADNGKSEKRAKERLTDLFNETETAHGGRYLERPPQQFRTLDSRYNQLVYDLAPAGVKALRDAGGLLEAGACSAGPWVHRFMTACVTASIELATLARPDVSFIAGHRVLARAKTELRHPVTIDDPLSRRRLEKALIPDALFGLEYRTPAGSRFRFFVVECDRATEPATSANFNRKSWLRSLLQYREYAGSRRYREHLQLTAPLLVLNVTTDRTRQGRMIAIAEKEAGADGNAYLLFKTVSDFGPVFRPPEPLLALLDKPWERAGRDPFRIDRP